MAQPLKEALKSLDGRSADWVQQAKNSIIQQQAFILNYHGKERLIQYAEVVQHDDREYLHCWTAKPGNRPDLPELGHNRLFFVGDDAQLIPTDAKWRSEGLDSIEITFRVCFTYRPKPEDLRIKEIEVVSVDGQSWTRVTQRISNLLWFLQRVSRYGDRCVIESPKEVRDVYLKKIKRVISMYK
ncbi:hypothetical protein S7335_1220 [Synechococcus sp. PCC 7335]|uniref:WYL domain-containing protein n=1 Tax=Synechococcus sp. (strain ATCC 29403 / PCC 7335) TaxID=91464 RepID=UPI00017EB92D|nr:WYL domain-containing protein [Synechococcus sp. PCC 7335]EDX82516.1 hypothetical protein S7335_1220 [Synechococcus sp. PCC 7335]